MLPAFAMIRFFTSLALCAVTLAAPIAVPVAAQSESRALRHVVIVSVDGLRPDLVTSGRAPAMQGQMRAGSFTLQARTVDEGYTVPSHVSMLTGVVPATHGVTWDRHI